jgi:hypothetical protein
MKLAEQWIRPDDAVSASSSIGPHIAHRAVLLPFPYPFAGIDTIPTISERVTVISAPAAARITAVAFDVRDSHSSVTRRFLRSPFLRGFRLVFRKDGIYVFRRERGSGTLR